MGLLSLGFGNTRSFILGLGARLLYICFKCSECLRKRRDEYLKAVVMLMWWICLSLERRCCPELELIMIKKVLDSG